MASLAILTMLSCQKSIIDTNPATSQNESTEEAQSRPGKTKYWDGNLNHDCEGSGKNCVVILPDYSIISAIESNELATYVLEHNSQLGFEDEIIQDIELDNSIVNHKFDVEENVQIRVVQD